MNRALLFPGQGSQFSGMGKDLYDSFPEARAVFEEADRTLGYSIAKIAFEGPDEELRRTANTQPAILTHSIAMLRVLETRHPAVLEGAAYLAGHSLGEYSAGVAAGSITFADAVRIVHQRGKFMQEAVPDGVGTMAAILGLAASDVCAACDEAALDTGRIVSPANFNSPEQTVIAGHAEAVAKASEVCKAKGAKRALPLPVSAPFHCALMQPAAERLEPLLNALALSDPSIPVITNVDAHPARLATEIREALIRQVVHSVRWVDSINVIADAGVTEALEIGPGSVLAGLARRIRKEITVRPLGTVADLSGIN